MLSEIAREAGQRFGDRAVVVAADGVLTYEELDRAADALAVQLSQRGVARGDRVGLLLPSGGDWVVAAVAVSRLGAVFAGISPTLSVPERATLISLLGARLTLADPTLLEGLPLRAEIAVMKPGSRAIELAALEPVASDFSSPAFNDLAADDDAAVICFTSGTTGQPKAAVYCISQLRGIQSIDLGPGAEQRWGGGSPMLASTQFAHVGMSTKLPWYLRMGNTLHVMPRWRAEDALRLVAQHRISTLGVVAPQLALMLRSPLMDSLDLTCVTSIIAGGAASAPSLVREARERFGAGYSIRYSSTESGGVGIATAFDSPEEDGLQTVGIARPGVEVRIADEQDSPLQTGEVGALQLRSAAVMQHYWNDPSATNSALTADRWLRTGDLASMDSTGRVMLAGRRSEMYIRGGYNVFPAEVEAALLEHPGVISAVVVPYPDEILGELGLAMICAQDPERPPTLEELREHGSHLIAKYKLPDMVVIAQSLPLTTAQKLDRAAAQTMAMNLLEA
ncbi:MAG: class I adenylate-forming enzyme family protein [Actinobacteria bacterium]|nr:class I adenylate-forming enzyme family protein [Actinomycetota bacterium]